MVTQNTDLTIVMITKEALPVLENELTHTRNVNRAYSDEFAKKGAKIGNTLNIRLPVRTVGSRSMTLDVEGQVETSVPLVVNKWYQTSMSFGSDELTLSIDDFSKRYIQPAMETIANMIDYDGLQLYKDVYNAVGTPGTTPANLQPYYDAGVKLNYEAAPMGNRKITVGPQAQATVAYSTINLFNPSKQISDSYIKGSMGMAAGFDWYMDQNVAVHTVGTYGGTPLVNGATAQGATTLVTDGWTATTTTLNVGDIFTVAGVFAVNPQNRQTTGQLRQFVVTATTTTDGGGNSTISFSPPMNAPVAGLPVYNQTVSALPADNAAITVFGASGTQTPQNLAFHPDAFTFACVDLEELPATESSRQASAKLGLSVRITRASDIVNSRAIVRIDVLAAWATIRPQLACRIAG